MHYKVRRRPKGFRTPKTACAQGCVTLGHEVQADGLFAERRSVIEEIACCLPVGKLVSHFAVGANCMICAVVSSSRRVEEQVFWCDFLLALFACQLLSAESSELYFQIPKYGVVQ